MSRARSRNLRRIPPSYSTPYALYGHEGNAPSYLFDGRSFTRAYQNRPPRPFTARYGRPFYVQTVVPPARGCTIPIAFDYIMNYTQITG